MNSNNNIGNTGDTNGHYAPPISPPVVVSDSELDQKQTNDHSPQGSLLLPISKETPLPPDIPKAKTLLDPNVKYLSFMTYAGLTNQFMALENAAYVALRINRTLIIPPITTNSHDNHNSNQRWSDFFDLSQFSTLTGLKVVEWSDIRPLNADQIEVGKRQVRAGGKHYPIWEKLADNLTCQVIYGFGDSERLHTTELTFARQFLFRPQFVRPPPRKNKTQVFDRAYIGSKDNLNMDDIVTIDDLVDRYEDNSDQLLFLSHSFKLKDPLGRRSWFLVGRHLHFLPKVNDYAKQLILHHAPETKEHGKYIAVHVRRGDIWQKCRDKTEEEMVTCIVPLGRYAEAVETAYRIAGERLPVLVATDSQSEEDHVAMAKLGWRRLNHNLYTTEKELGIFGPALVDAAILVNAEVMVGSYSSSMSRVAARRQRGWRQREALYP
ncbi:hypothetical protein BX616_010181 [Lobosporangium transversale]|nr:hypothetical protein BX616_010181 [Lobosporangium transversale]